MSGRPVTGRRVREVLAFSALALALAASPAAAEPVPSPAVDGPVQGGLRGHPWNHSLFQLRGRGYDYTEREYFVSGTATERSTGATAPYRSRMLVRLPRDREDFEGIVLVEWLNVTSQADLETAWPVAARYMMRNGMGYVGVSAQLAGVCCGPTTLKGWDPVRYATLAHPGDPFSYDVFSQALEAVRTMRKPRPRHVVVTGASQSAAFLTAFVNQGYERGLVDAYVITRGGGPFEEHSTPIFQLNEEGLEELPPDDEDYVAWEEAGTAHAPAVWHRYVWRMFQRDLLAPGVPDPIDTACSVNHGSVDYSTRALSRWVARYLRTGRLPPSVPRIARDPDGEVVRDRHGLAVGGVRHPFVEVPVSVNTSEGCPLYGTFAAWDSERITELYPTKGEYVKRVRRAARRGVRRGWMLRGDRRKVVRKAKRFSEPWSDEGCDPCEPQLGL